MPYTTTLNDIRAAKPCMQGWRTLCEHLRAEGNSIRFPVSTVLESNGLYDALWVLAHTCGIGGLRGCVRFAADAAERVLFVHERFYMTDLRPRRDIDAARGWVGHPSTPEGNETTEAAARASRDALNHVMDDMYEQARGALAVDRAQLASLEGRWVVLSAAAVAARASAHAAKTAAAFARAVDVAQVFVSATRAATFASCYATRGVEETCGSAERVWQRARLLEILNEDTDNG